MIISGGSRSNWRFFSKHLVKTEENERVEIAEIRGLAADTVLDAFREMDALASGTRAKNFFYHANLNPRADETLTPQQWDEAVDALEAELGLNGHSRFIVEHHKEGRTHRHVVWSRIDPETMTAVSDSNNYAAHERAARALEAAFGHEPVQGVHTRDPDIERPDRRPENWETFRGHRSGIDPQEMKAELTQLWNRSDSGTAFVAALEEQGYILAKGDKRDFVVIDQAGELHSLARRIEGTKAKDIRERMADVEPDAVLTIHEAKALAKSRAERPSEEAPKEHALSVPPATAEQRPENVWQEALHQVEKPLSSGEALDVFASSVKDAMHHHGGELPLHDGLTLWERVVGVISLASVAWEAFSWLKGQWQDFLFDETRRPATPESHDHRRER